MAIPLMKLTFLINSEYCTRWNLPFLHSSSAHKSFGKVFFSTSGFKVEVEFEIWDGVCREVELSFISFFLSKSRKSKLLR